MSSKRRTCYLTPHEMFRLDLACKPIAEAFGTPYLVGSVHERPDFRDVDVRLILADDEYDLLVTSPEARTMLSVAFTAYLRESTGLPIDFGIQRRTEANEQHSTSVHNTHTDPIIGCRCAENAPAPKWRNPLGLRSLTDWTGDAPPTTPPTVDPRTTARDETRTP